jgi:ABC-type uncharacterized transport system substrate-binding protein
MLPLMESLKKVGLGAALICASSAVLLYSDFGSRNRNGAGGGRGNGPFRVAIVQQTSIPALDDGVEGMLAALKERGYEDGGRIAVHRYNAQGDTATANAIATEVTSGDNDLILTVSTISLQTVANANRNAIPPRKHVFGVVTDPYSIGVGVSSQNHAVHPPYMTGIGSSPPVAELFALARELRPSLKRVGLVWNPAEANSLVATKLGRAVCSSLGIELIEANAENATMVGDAVSSVLAQNVEAIWVSPDLTTGHGLDVIIRKAKVAGVPVFSSIPTATPSGTLFDLGADYEGIGYASGMIAAEVLGGRDPAAIPVEEMMPSKLQVNRLALKGLRDQWNLPESVIARADVVVDESGRHVHAAGAKASNGGGTK